MLSPEEFTVGSFKTAKPGSLILPRTPYEALALICEGDGEATAVFLAGQHTFHSFPSGEADNWKGLIVPDVRIEVDEASLFDPDQNHHVLGAIVRSGTKLMVRSKAEHSFGRSVPVTIQSDLPDGSGSAAFTRWRIVVGLGDGKRVLHTVDLGEAPKQ